MTNNLHFQKDFINVKFFERIDVNFVLSQGRNVLIATSSEAGTVSSDIAALVGIDIDDASSAAIDHVHNAGQSTLIKAIKVCVAFV